MEYSTGFGEENLAVASTDFGDATAGLSAENYATMGGERVEEDVFAAAEEEEEVDEFALIREWNMKRREQLDEKEKIEAENRVALREKARAALQAHIDEKQHAKELKQKSNRDIEAAILEDREAENSYENPFERVVKLIDLSIDTEAADTTRMKSVLIHLKDKPLSETRPGA